MLDLREPRGELQSRPDAHVVRVIFFGRLRDLAGRPATDVPLGVAAPLSTFRVHAAGGDEALGEALCAASIRVAVNAVIVARGGEPMVSPGDEVAFMPPFSGG